MLFSIHLNIFSLNYVLLPRQYPTLPRARIIPQTRHGQVASTAPRVLPAWLFPLTFLPIASLTQIRDGSHSSLILVSSLYLLVE